MLPFQFMPMCKGSGICTFEVEFVLLKRKAASEPEQDNKPVAASSILNELREEDLQKQPCQPLAEGSAHWCQCR